MFSSLTKDLLHEAPATFFVQTKHTTISRSLRKNSHPSQLKSPIIYLFPFTWLASDSPIPSHIYFFIFTCTSPFAPKTGGWGSSIRGSNNFPLEKSIKIYSPSKKLPPCYDSFGFYVAFGVPADGLMYLMTPSEGQGSSTFPCFFIIPLAILPRPLNQWIFLLKANRSGTYNIRKTNLKLIWL